MLLYQYRGAIDNEETFAYLVNLIEDGSIKFSKPSEFNDPFDCCPTQWSELPKNSLPHAVGDMLNKTIQEAISKIHGVTCFTPHPDKMLMWSHYGAQHKGVCVGFDTTILLANPPLNSQGKSLYNKIKKVEYTNIRPDENDKKTLYKKSEEWSYEEEHRLISTKQIGKPEWGAGVWELPTSAIKEIIIGARVQPRIEEKIVNLIKSTNKDITIKKAVLNMYKFELSIEKLDEQPNVAPMSGMLLDPNSNWIKL